MKSLLWGLERRSAGVSAEEPDEVGPGLKAVAVGLTRLEQGGLALGAKNGLKMA